ncbi:MAG: TlpA family protein disulfide reductase [Candidatus Omnitrophota bacterium]
MKVKIALLIIILILGVEILFLVKKNNEQRRELAKCQFILYTPSKAIANDRSLPMFDFLEFTDLKTGMKKRFRDMAIKDRIIVFAFSTDCFSCDKMSEQWNPIYDALHDKYAIFGISKGGNQGIEDYVYRNSVRFPVYQYESLAGVDFFDSFPATIITDPDGNVVRSFNGLTEDLKNKIIN